MLYPIRRDETKRVKFMRLLFLWLALGAILVGVTFLARKSHAQSVEVSQGVALSCDTKEAAEMFVKLTDTEDQKEAITQVNTKHGEHNCVIGMLAYVRGDNVETIDITKGTINLAKITVLGFQKGGQWFPLKEPSEQFSAFMGKPSTPS